MPGPAVLRVAADDVCEVFVNGTRVGSHQTWQRTAVFSVGNLLTPGVNALAVRAEKHEIARWQQVDFDDRDWKPVAVAAPFGGGP